MGNYISFSCTDSNPAGKHSKPIMVILPNGEIRQLSTPVKAAELMLENPNFFLVNTQSLHLGRRFSALSADEDLEIANSYVMFPMKRLSSVVTAGDVGILPETGEVVAAVGEKWRGNEKEVVVVVPRMGLDDEEFSSPEFKYRLSMGRSRKPMLETIAEEHVCSR